MRTRVGYSGGAKLTPTYRDMGDHTESIQIDFDPSRITYARLLEVFWRSHDPCGRAWSRQYMAAVFVHNETQERLALETKAREEARRGATVHTAILPFERFWIAEDYHQKYYLRNDAALMREFEAIYPDAAAFTASTAAARANAYVAGHGPAEDLGTLGLSEEATRRLRQKLK